MCVVYIGPSPTYILWWSMCLERASLESLVSYFNQLLLLLSLLFQEFLIDRECNEICDEEAVDLNDPALSLQIALVCLCQLLEALFVVLN